MNSEKTYNLVDRIILLRRFLNTYYKDIDHSKMFKKGFRWKDNDKIIHFFQRELDKNISEINQQDIDLRIINALKEAGKADYWYTYEKEY